VPRLSRIRTGALEDLAEQLRYTPRSTVRKQVQRAIALANEIDPARNYAEDWVLQRLTGYPQSVEDPSLFVGEALLGDLSAFVERLTDRTGFTAADFPGPAIPVDALCERWGVSRKTVERYKRVGLVAFRASQPGGVSRLLVPVASIESFEQRHALRLASARDFARLTDAERARLLRRAARYRRSIGLSLSAIARRLAEHTGRSPETLRALLRAHDRASDDPLFDAQRPPAERRRRLAFGLWRRGFSLRAIGERLAVEREGAFRLINERRAGLLRALDLADRSAPGEPIELPPETVLNQPFVQRPGWAPGERDARAFVRAARESPPPDAEEERTLAFAVRLLRERTRESIARLPDSAPAAAVLDAIETDLRWTTILLARLVRDQYPTILRAIEERTQGPLTALPPPALRAGHGAALLAAAQSAARFDPARGGRLAGQITLAVARLPALRGVAVAPGSDRRAEPAALPLDDWTLRIAPWQRWLDPTPAQRAAMDTLDERRRAAVQARLGWFGERPLTARELRERFGVSPRALRRWMTAAPPAPGGSPVR